MTIKQIYDLISERLENYTKQYKRSDGSIPDNIKSNPEYIRLKNDYNIAFANLRKYNSAKNKLFKSLKSKSAKK
jgi:hypothetical protein